MNTKQIGDIAEAQVIANFIKSGKTVLIPFGDRNRYDLVVDTDGVLERIQVKSAKLKGNKLKFSAKSVSTKNGKVINNGYKGQIEKFAVYSPELNKMYLISVNDCTEDTNHLHLTTPKNNQKSKIKLAEKYEWGVTQR